MSTRHNDLKYTSFEEIIHIYKIIGNFSRQLPGFQAKSLPSCARQAGFHKRTYFLFTIFIYLFTVQTFLFCWGNRNELLQVKECPQWSHVQGKYKYICSYLTYKLGSVHEHEKQTNVFDMTTRVLEEENIASLELLFETNVQCNHGIIGPFLDLAHASHPLLPCHVDCYP